MSKSDKTYQLEETIALAMQARGRIGCPEVGLGDEGIVDYITMDISSPERTVMCFELKITRSDFLSDAKKTFIGDLNYYVIPTSLWNSVRAHIQPGVGCWCVDESGQANCMLEAVRQECSLDRGYVARKIVYCLKREHWKISETRWAAEFGHRSTVPSSSLREFMPQIMEHATDKRHKRYGAAAVRLPGQDAVSDLVTVEMGGKGHVRCYQLVQGEREVAEGPSGLAGDFNFYVMPLSLWGRARNEVPSWIGIWCIDDHGRAIRKRNPRHVSGAIGRGTAMAAVAFALDRERMGVVERSWRERQYSQKILDREHGEVGVGNHVRFGGSEWIVRRVEYERDGTVLVPMLVTEAVGMDGVMRSVPPKQVRRVEEYGD